jgi:hypothetical protein
LGIDPVVEGWITRSVAIQIEHGRCIRVPGTIMSGNHPAPGVATNGGVAEVEGRQNRVDIVNENVPAVRVGVS